MSEGREKLPAFTFTSLEIRRARNQPRPALEAQRAPGDQHPVANPVPFTLSGEALWVVGISALSQEELDRTITVLEEILAIHRTRGDDLGATQPLSALGMIAMQGGDHERARLLLDESLAMIARYDDP